MFSQYQIWPDSDFFCVFECSCGSKIIFLIPVSMKVDRGYNMVTPQCLSLCVLVWVVAGVGGSPSSLRRGKSVWTKQQSWEEARLPCWIFFTIIRKIIISKLINRDFSLDEFWNSGQKHSGYIEKNMWEFRNQNKTILNSSIFLNFNGCPTVILEQQSCD